MFPLTFTTADGLKLKCSAKFDSDSIAGILIVVHGLGDHSQSLPYTLLEPFFTERNIAVLRYDLRGHGESEGIRHHIDSWSDLRDDLGRFIRLARHELPKLPIFLLGLSLGGLIVLDHAIHSPEDIAGLIVLAPALSADGASRPVRFVVPILARFFPKLSVDPGLDRQNISRDWEAAETYLADPLFSTRVTTRFASETLKTVLAVQENAPRLTPPLLVLHGDADVIVPAKASANLFDRASSTRKDRIVYPGALHNLLLETNRDQVYSDILDWVKKSAAN